MNTETSAQNNCKTILETDVKNINPKKLSLNLPKNEANYQDTSHTDDFFKTVKFNVGGSVFETRLSILKMFPRSYFGHMFNGIFKQNLNPQNPIFIDRSRDVDADPDSGTGLGFEHRVREPGGAGARS